MTPHSERDDYPTMSATASSQPVKPLKVRPVVPLKFGQGRKNKPSISAVARVANDTPPKNANDHIANGHVKTTEEERLNNGHTTVGVNEPTTDNSDPRANTTNELLTDASLERELPEATPQSVETTSETFVIAAPPSQAIATSPQPPPDRKQQPTQNQVQSPEVDQIDQETNQEQKPETTDVTRQQHSIDQATPFAPMQPPSGLSTLPFTTTHANQDQRTRNGINGLSFGAFNDFSAPRSAHGSFSNGIISPPHEALIHAPAFVPGHSHHVSVTNTPITTGLPSAMFPPPGFDPRPAGFVPYGSDYPPFDGRMHGSVSLDTPITNGNSGPGSRTMSHSSNGHTELNSSMTTDDTFRRLSGRPQSNGRPMNGSVHLPPVLMPATQRPDPSVENAMMLRDFVLAQFGSADFADHLLEVDVKGKLLLSIPVHSMIVSRSPAIRRLIVSSRETASEAPVRVIRLSVDDTIFVEQAFIEVVQYLYGAPLAPGFPSLVSQVPPFSTRDTHGETAQFARQVLSHALSLVSSGCVLQVEPAVMEAIQAVVRLIRWDTIPLALSFILQDGPPTSWQNNNHENGRRVSASFSLRDSIAGQLLRDVIDYLAVNFPHHFNFDASVAQLEASPRLPMILDAKPSMSSHRLSRMQFGQLPAEQSDYVTSTLSSILISLPLEVLTTLLGHPALVNRGKNFQLTAIVNAVIADRETRRQNVLNSKRIAPRGDGPLADATLWREQVIEDPQSITGFNIIRQRVEK